MTSYLSAAAYTAMFFDYSETPKDVIAILELLDNLRLGEIESGLKGLNPNLIRNALPQSRVILEDFLSWSSRIIRFIAGKWCSSKIVFIY